MTNLYYIRRIVSFVTDVHTFVVMYVPEYVMVVPVVTYVLCAIMMSACMSTLGVRTVLGSKIRVRNIF